jgi:vancomycin resistance protein VanJ
MKQSRTRSLLRARSRRAVVPLSYAGVFAILAWYVLFLKFGDGLRGLGYANAAGFWFGVIALTLAAMLLRMGVFWLGMLSLVLGGSILIHGGPYIASGRNRPPTRAISVRVVTASLRGLNNDMQDAAGTLARLRADIVVLQEVSRPEELTALLDRSSGRRWFAATSGWQVTLSRWPLRDIVRARDLLEVRIISPGGDFRVWNVRAPKSFMTPRHNRHYIASLIDRIARAGNRGIAAGDFNATPWNDGYRDVHRLLDDVRDRSGWGPGFTFPNHARRMGTFGPFLRIDHIMADRRFVPVGVHTRAASRGADHLPVVADFAFVPPVPIKAPG